MVKKKMHGKRSFFLRTSFDLLYITHAVLFAGIEEDGHFPGDDLCKTCDFHHIRAGKHEEACRPGIEETDALYSKRESPALAKNLLSCILIFT